MFYVHTGSIFTAIIQVNLGLLVAPICFLYSCYEHVLGPDQNISYHVLQHSVIVML